MLSTGTSGTPYSGSAIGAGGSFFGVAALSSSLLDLGGVSVLVHAASPRRRAAAV
jgi:hypothetical protein